MQPGLSDADRERIRAFVNTAKYRRSPEILLKEADEE